jgi:hypothetical protein
MYSGQRHGSVDSLERSLTESPLPELPETLQKKTGKTSF